MIIGPELITEYEPRIEGRVKSEHTCLDGTFARTSERSTGAQKLGDYG